MGPPFTNVKLRRRFDLWLRKYKTVDCLIRKVKHDIWLSIRNEKIFEELSRKKKDGETSVSDNEQKSNRNKDHQYFSIADGEITFK